MEQPACIKVPHASRAKAMRHLVKLKGKRRPSEAKEGRLCAYVCRYCGAWHVGDDRTRGA